MLLTVMILSGSILGASTIAGYLMLLRVRASSDITNSAKAIFAADTGVEWELYKRFGGNPAQPKPFLSNGADFETSGGLLSLKSIGHSAGVFRAFELYFTTATFTLP